MANQKLTDKTELAAVPSNDDWIHIVDKSDITADPAGTSKKIQYSNFIGVLTTIITDTTTAFDGSQKGQSNVYRFNKTTAQTVEVDPNDYATDDIIIIERGDLGGTLEITAPSGEVHCGKRNSENRFFINDRNSVVALKKLAIGKMQVFGNLTTGYTGAVTTASYGTLREGDVSVAVTVTGTGFSTNMLDPVVSANATLVSWAYVSSTEITLTLTAVGSETDTVTVTYDNGDEFVDTDAITIAAASASELYNNYAFEYGWALFKLKASQTYGINVRRSSDNATTDVGFNGSGKIALDSTVSAGGTLATWAGSDDVFIVTMYNQGDTGATFDLTQATTTDQPKFLNAGALIQQSTVTMTEFDGSDDILGTSGTAAWANGDFSIFCNGNTQVAANGNLIGWQDATAVDRMPFIRFNSTPAIQSFNPVETGGQDILVSGTLSTGTNYKVVTISNTGGTELFVDGSSVDTGVQTTPTPTESKGFEMGGTSENSIFLDGYMSYAVVYTSDEDANRTSIQTIIDASL